MQEIENLKEINTKPSRKPRLPQVPIKQKESVTVPNMNEEKKEIIEEALATENNENQNPLTEEDDDKKEGLQTIQAKQESKSMKGFMSKLKKAWK